MNVANDFARETAGGCSELTKQSAVAVGYGPIGDIAADTAGGGALVVTNYADDSVSVVDTETLTVDSTVYVGGEPLVAAVADNRVYVAAGSASYDAVAVVDTDAKAVIATYPLDLSIRAIAVGPDRKRVFVSRTRGDGADVAVIDTTTDEVTPIEIPMRAAMTIDAVRVSPDGQRLYVAASDTYAAKLVVVDAEEARVVDTVPVLAPIRDVAVSPDDAAVYLLTCDPRRGGAVITIDASTHRIAGTVAFGGFPSQMTLSADGTRAYIVDRMHVAVMCTVTNGIVENLAVGAQPSCVATSPDGTRLYVADYAGVITAFSVSAAVTVPNVQAMAMDVADVRELEPAV
jgi:YVTN family beta-propeller protein